MFCHCFVHSPICVAKVLIWVIFWGRRVSLIFFAKFFQCFSTVNHFFFVQFEPKTFCIIFYHRRIFRSRYDVFLFLFSFNLEFNEFSGGFCWLLMFLSFVLKFASSGSFFFRGWWNMRRAQFLLLLSETYQIK